MKQLRLYLVVFSAALIFLFNAALLDFVGWPYTDGAGNILTKIHPAFYPLLITLVIQVFYGGRPVARTIFSPPYLIFITASLILLIRAVLIVMSGVTQGELTAVIVTWTMPALLVVALIGWDASVLSQWGTSIRLFMVLNSVMGLAERVIGRRLIPSPLDFSDWLESRATAMLSHPLNAALMTGIMIIILVTSRPGRLKPWMRVPEIGLHVAAMFAFGGRSALVFAVAILVMSGILARQAKSETRLSPVQRALPFLVIFLGVALVSLPFEFVDATIDRFTNDTSSSETRNAAVQMLGTLDARELLFGIDANRRQILLDFYHTPLGIEISWISMTITYGLLATLPMAVALPLFMFSRARQLDRSAFYVAIYFLLVTTGSLSIGSKSLLVCQTILAMVTLCQKRLAADPTSPQVMAAALAVEDRRSSVPPAPRPANPIRTSRQLPPKASPAGPDGKADELGDLPDFLD